MQKTAMCGLCDLIVPADEIDSHYNEHKGLVMKCPFCGSDEQTHQVMEDVEVDTLRPEWLGVSSLDRWCCNSCSRKFFIEAKSLKFSGAERFRARLVRQIVQAPAKVEVKRGIVYMTFSDGSVLDFTEPMTKPPHILCDECREQIPDDVDRGSVTNKHHKPSCSLYDVNED